MTKSGIPKPGDFNSAPSNKEELTMIYQVIEKERLWSWLRNFRDDKLDANYRFLRAHQQLAAYDDLLFDEIFSHMINIAKCGWEDYYTDLLICNKIFNTFGQGSSTKATFFSVKGE